MRLLIVPLVAMAALCLPSAQAQRQPTHQVMNFPNGSSSGVQGFFGAVIVPIGDLDGDSINDYAVSAPDVMAAGARGAVYAYSGRSSLLIQTFIGPPGTGSTGFGRALARAGDLDGDGLDDLIISASAYDPGGAPLQGRVQAFSSASGQALWTIDGNASGSLGSSLSVTTVSGQRIVVASEPTWNGVGRVLFIDPPTGVTVGFAAGTSLWQSFGLQVAASIDLPGVYVADGRRQIFEVDPTAGPGSVPVLVHSRPMALGINSPSLCLIANPGSASPRLALGWALESANGFVRNGIVELLDLGPTTPVLTISGSASDARFGKHVARGHDVDGDGVEEILVLEASEAGTFVTSSTVSLYSQSGQLAETSTRPGDEFSSASCLRDVTGDGLGDWLHAARTGNNALRNVGLYSRGLERITFTTNGGATTWSFALDAGPQFALTPYIQGFSASGSIPGNLLSPSSVLLPLNFDALFFSILGISGQGAFTDFAGSLNSQGQATVTFTVPISTALTILGLPTSTAAVAISGPHVVFASNPYLISF